MQRSRYEVNSVEKLSLGGVDQWIWARGMHRDNPILLILHGGPGSAQIGLVGDRLNRMEAGFLVVDWDQRGAGKSYSPNIAPSSMSMEQIAQDCIELIEKLVERFGQQKLFLLGHSWGSALGMRVAMAVPEHIYAYIGVGQVANAIRNDIVSYEYVLAEADRRGLRKAVKELEALGSPPWQVKTALVQRRWLQKLGGGVNPKAVQPTSKLLRSRQYRLADWVSFVRGKLFSLNTLWSSYQAIDLAVQVPALSVPVHFLLGRKDFNTPSALAEAYLAELDAPVKELTWFEDSGHAPMYEEAEKFANAMYSIRDRYCSPEEDGTR